MTSEQGVLFGADGGLAYRPSPRRESPGARERVRGRAKTFRGLVLDALRDGPKTDEEICRLTGMRGDSVRPRRGELVHLGMVEDSGEVRPTHSGRPAIVWRLKEPSCGVTCEVR